MLLEFARNYKVLGETDKRRERAEAGRQQLELLVANDPSNITYQRDLAVAYEAVGDVLATKGRINEALAEYRSGLAILERLANPEDAVRHNLSLFQVRIGDVLVEQGKLDEALAIYLAADSSARRLAQSDLTGYLKHR